jgi:hypothetical protein
VQLLDEVTSRGRRVGIPEPWNGCGWYVSSGDEDNDRSRDDACQYGFGPAGGA